MNHWAQKLIRFWRMPFFTKLHALSTQYYKLKALLIYRLAFKEFGAGSYIRRPLLILNPSYIRIGKRVGIRDGARLEVVCDAKREPLMQIGDGTSIEQGVHIVCHHRVAIGHDVTISANCCILDVTHPYENVLDPAKIGNRLQDDDAFVEIGGGSLIGFGCVVLPNVRIGEYVVIGANSVVTSSIPSFSVAVGNPARVVKQFDEITGSWTRSTESIQQRSISVSADSPTV
jgi:acetyltransferase-like isoleucine patch superfamily enzyme